MNENRAKWFDLLSKESILLAENLVTRAATERVAGKEIYPSQDNILRALDLTPPEKVKAIILGQDPYFNPGQANGLAFSVNSGVVLPPSLKNIFKELRADTGITPSASGDLCPWAKQGVLLLNTVLTVEKGKPNSHSTWGWQQFILSVLQACLELPQPIVFMLWGNQARAFIADLQLTSNQSNKLYLLSSHPSPLGARKGNKNTPAFLGSKPFSRCNMYLQQMGVDLVDWNLSQPELYMLKPESQKIVIDRLTDMAKKDTDLPINAFYFLYGIGKLIDGVKTGEEFYDYLQSKSTDLMYDRTRKLFDYIRQLEKGSVIYELGKRLMCSCCDGAVCTIFYNNYHKEELVKIFDEELF